MAQLGFAASLIGEILTGKGPLAQLGLETGVCVCVCGVCVIHAILHSRWLGYLVVKVHWAPHLLTSPAPLALLGAGIPLYEIEGGLAAWVLFLFFAAINPGTGKFVNDEDQ